MSPPDPALLREVKDYVATALAIIDKLTDDEYISASDYYNMLNPDFPGSMTTPNITTSTASEIADSLSWRLAEYQHVSGPAYIPAREARKELATIIERMATAAVAETNGFRSPELDSVVKELWLMGNRAACMAAKP